MSTMILRVVARGGEVEDGDCNLDAPCDLVAIEMQGDGVGRELDRKQFNTGHDASRYLASILKREE